MNKVVSNLRNQFYLRNRRVYPGRVSGLLITTAVWLVSPEYSLPGLPRETRRSSLVGNWIISHELRPQGALQGGTGERRHGPPVCPLPQASHWDSNSRASFETPVMVPACWTGRDRPDATPWLRSAAGSSAVPSHVISLVTHEANAAVSCRSRSIFRLNRGARNLFLHLTPCKAISEDRESAERRQSGDAASGHIRFE